MRLNPNYFVTIGVALTLFSVSQLGDIYGHQWVFYALIYGILAVVEGEKIGLNRRIEKLEELLSDVPVAPHRANEHVSL